MTNYRKEAVHSGIERLEAEIDNFMQSINLSDAVKMQFLEQSAKYLGVYVANEPASLSDVKVIN
ncbi:MAG: hypothetical protein OEY66_10160 [Gammaproteobacteria bacterium]|nr:hypothetical protein [Gammaproteobacteria bacterium]